MAKKKGKRHGGRNEVRHHEVSLQFSGVGKSRDEAIKAFMAKIAAFIAKPKMNDLYVEEPLNEEDVKLLREAFGMTKAEAEEFLDGGNNKFEITPFQIASCGELTTYKDELGVFNAVIEQYDEGDFVRMNGKPVNEKEVRKLAVARILKEFPEFTKSYASEVWANLMNNNSDGDFPIRGKTSMTFFRDGTCGTEGKRKAENIAAEYGGYHGDPEELIAVYTQTEGLQRVIPQVLGKAEKRSVDLY